MFSEKFNVERKEIDNFGAIDISLVSDIPMFVDPILIFNSSKREYRKLHNKMIKYMYFLAQKARKGLNKAEIKTWFSFNEVCNNWLGFSMNGNKGLALDKKFANFLYENIGFVLETNNISNGRHIEKIMLLFPGSGKDKISDLTVNLIKGYLCEYTEKFAKKYIKDDNLAMNISVDKAEFNYDTECFVSKEYYLPYIINEKGKIEYVLLTPNDILRSDEQTINRNDFLDNYNKVRNSIDNDTLRIQVDNYLKKAIVDYHDKCKNLNKEPKESEEEKIKKYSFEEFAREHKEIYDYYIKLKESQKEEISNITKKEVSEQVKKFIENRDLIVKIVHEQYKKNTRNTYSLVESIARVKFLKDIFENKGGYKLFYESRKDKVMYSSEKELQILFKFVWRATFYKIDAETDNGDGPADFVVSYGSNDSTVIEFKLASNKKLAHVFKQVKVYEKANETNKKVITLFYFNDKEYDQSIKIIKDNKRENEIDKTIFLIDCRNRESASNRKK